MAVPAIAPTPSLPTLPSLPDLGNIGSNGAAASPQAAAGAGSSFASMLSGQISALDASQQTASAAQNALATGQTTDVTSVMLATQKATLDLQLATNVRDRLIEAYQTVMDMQL